jgi:hypothetical protein
VLVGAKEGTEPVQESLDEETQRACYRAGMGKPMTNYNELVSIIISLSAAYLEFFLQFPSSSTQSLLC